MTYTTNSTQTLFFTTPSINAVPETTAAFKRLSVDEQLAVLWFAYTESGRSITPAATGAARLQMAEGLIDRFKQMSYDEQLQAMRDLANGVNTPISRAYGILSTNTKLAFWYVLADLMVEGTVVPVPASYKLSRDGEKVLQAIQGLDFNQQITVLRNTVVDMGVNPF